MSKYTGSSAPVRLRVGGDHGMLSTDQKLQMLGGEHGGAGKGNS
jgi:hypothetical protein